MAKIHSVVAKVVEKIEAEAEKASKLTPQMSKKGTRVASIGIIARSRGM